MKIDVMNELKSKLKEKKLRKQLQKEKRKRHKERKKLRKKGIQVDTSSEEEGSGSEGKDSGDYDKASTRTNTLFDMSSQDSEIEDTVRKSNPLDKILNPLVKI